MTKQVGDYIIKGEFAYVTGKYFAIIDTDRNGDTFLDSLGELQRDHIRWGVALKSPGRDTTSPGVTINRPEYDTALVQDKFDTDFQPVYAHDSTTFISILFEFLLINFTSLHEIYLTRNEPSV